MPSQIDARSRQGFEKYAKAASNRKNSRSLVQSIPLPNRKTGNPGNLGLLRKSLPLLQWTRSAKRGWSSAMAPRTWFTLSAAAVAVHYSVMGPRLLAIALILATIFQASALVYAATVGASIGDAITHACGGQPLDDGRDCGTCCAHAAMPSCTAQCPVPVGVAVLPALPLMQRTALRGIVMPELGIGPLTEHDPPDLLRPPIV